jgi:hypothetical protein
VGAPARGPSGTVIDDIIDETVYRDAVSEELRRSGRSPAEFNVALPQTGRPAFVERWCTSNGFPPPRRRAVACRVLEARSNGPIASSAHVRGLRQLYSDLRTAFARPA